MGKEPLIGINIGCNKNSENPINDYLYCINKFYLIADYITVNISSPNTPGLRSFHKKDKLDNLLKNIKTKTLSLEKKYTCKLPLVLKISPDLNKNELTGVIKLVTKFNFDAIIASNTSINKTLLNDEKCQNQPGGISGKALFEHSNKTLKKIKILRNKKVSIIASGGINNWESIGQKIYLGATAVQIYTGLVYEGPSMIDKSLTLLSNYLKKKKIPHISKIVLDTK